MNKEEFEKMVMYYRDKYYNEFLHLYKLREESGCDSKFLIRSINKDIEVANKYIDETLRNSKDLEDAELKGILLSEQMTIIFLENKLREINLKEKKLNNTTIPFTWARIFKDADKAEFVLDQISEFLNDAGEWIEEPKGKLITALYLDLKDKGYLITDASLSNPKALRVFTNQFKVKLGQKEFQPERSNSAIPLRERFKMIPSLKKK